MNFMKHYNKKTSDYKRKSITSLNLSIFVRLTNKPQSKNTIFSECEYTVQPVFGTYFAILH